MIQFFRLDKSRDIDSEYSIIKDREVSRFFFKKSLYLFLFVYSTLFLAVAIPFVKTPCMAVYFIGSLATTFYLIRFINYIVKYNKYKGGSIHFNTAYVEIKSAEKTVKIPADEITFLEVNLAGNLLIRDKYSAVSFPLGLLPEESRELVKQNLEDLSPKRSALIKKVWELADAIVVALVLAVHIIQYVVQAYYIPTGSMEETLKIGDHLFVEKITYGPVVPRMLGMDKGIHLKFLSIREIERGDIVIFTPPVESEKHKDYIKRCIALPGDDFSIKDGFVYINGKKQDEPYTLGKPTDYAHFNIGSHNNIEGIVPDGKIIVLGDNRTNSSDGRYFGYLDIDSVKGRALVLYWNTKEILNGNFSHLGLIK